MKLCCYCATPLTADEIEYYGTTCNECEGRLLERFNDEFNENQRDRLVVDSQFDGLVETVIVRTGGEARV